MLRRVKYIKHPLTAGIPLKQKKKRGHDRDRALATRVTAVSLGYSGKPRATNVSGAMSDAVTATVFA